MKRRTKTGRRSGFTGASVALITSLGCIGTADAQTTGTPAASGLPLPRFVSLKSDKVNVRKGPGTEYPIAFVFKRAGLPVEVLREYESWREVRDAEGATGWVTQSLLSGRRTALVEPGAAKGALPGEVAIRATESETAAVVAKVEAGVIANLLSCDGTWCHVSVEAFKGYLPQKTLWGVYEKEPVK